MTLPLPRTNKYAAPMPEDFENVVFAAPAFSRTAVRTYFNTKARARAALSSPSHNFFAATAGSNTADAAGSPGAAPLPIGAASGTTRNSGNSQQNTTANITTAPIRASRGRADSLLAPIVA